MLPFTARRHIVGVLSLFWIASFAATVLPELHRNYQDILVGRADVDPFSSALGVILVGLGLSLGPPALLIAFVGFLMRRSPLNTSQSATAIDGRRRSDAQPR